MIELVEAVTVDWPAIAAQHGRMFEPCGPAVFTSKEGGFLPNYDSCR